jgi:hypothetical protein
MARLANFGKRRPSRRTRQQKKAGFPFSPFVRCIEFAACLLAFGSLLLLVLDAARHPHSREAISIAVLLSCCIFIRVSYDSIGIWTRHHWLGGGRMKTIDRMRGIEFEQFCAELFRRKGFKVATTKASGDQGADLILEGKNGRAVVQAKRSNSKVGNWAVQEVLAAKGFYAAQRALVLTNNRYSNSARALAAANGVELLDRNDLAKMLGRAAGRSITSARQPH